MKNRILWAGVLALAITLSSQVQTMAITNGVIFISTREPQDTAGAQDSTVNQEPGPGMCSPGDVAMGDLLGDHGYATRVLVDRLLGDTAGAWVTAPPPRDTLMSPVNPDLAPMLLIVSGSSASAVIPFPTQTNGIPMMMGEHSGLGDRVLSGSGSIYMYSNGTSSTDFAGTAASGLTNNPTKYMKVIDDSHPIMQGIPLDAQGRVKIFRDPYPEELKYKPTTGGRENYEYRWCTIPASNAAPGTKVLGVMDSDTNRAVFAVNDVGGLLAENPGLGYAETNQVRLVHFFVNENGSGGPRRVFLAVTDIGRVLFVRAAKWAMGETLTPYQPLMINISALSNTSVQVQWTASADKNYKIIGSPNLTTPLFDWQTLAEDIPGVNGTIQKTLDIAAAPQAAFLRVAAVP